MVSSIPVRGNGQWPAPRRRARCDEMRLPDRHRGLTAAWCWAVPSERLAQSHHGIPSPGETRRCCPRTELPAWFQSVLNHGLDTSIDNGRNAQRACALPLGNLASTNRVDMLKVELAELMTQPPSCFRRGHEPAIHTRCVLSLIHLGDTTNACEHVRLTPQHQSRKRSDAVQIAVS